MIGLARGASIPFSTYKIQAKIAKNKSARASAVKILWNFGQDVRKLKQLEKDNARLLRLLGQRDVEIDAMKELLAKKW